MKSLLNDILCSNSQASVSFLMKMQDISHQAHFDKREFACPSHSPPMKSQCFEYLQQTRRLSSVFSFVPQFHQYSGNCWYPFLICVEFKVYSYILCPTQITKMSRSVLGRDRFISIFGVLYGVIAPALSIAFIFLIDPSQRAGTPCIWLTGITHFPRAWLGADYRRSPRN